MEELKKGQVITWTNSAKKSLIHLLDYHRIEMEHQLSNLEENSSFNVEEVEKVRETVFDALSQLGNAINDLIEQVDTVIKAYFGSTYLKFLNVHFQKAVGNNSTDVEYLIMQLRKGDPIEWTIESKKGYQKLIGEEQNELDEPIRVLEEVHLGNDPQKVALAIAKVHLAVNYAIWEFEKLIRDLLEQVPSAVN